MDSVTSLTQVTACTAGWADYGSAWQSATCGDTAGPATVRVQL